MDPIDEARLLDTWHRNAAAWTWAVRTGRITSRRMTDRAIVEAVLARTPRSALDLGCGEGWLARRLGAAGVRVLGVDAVAALIASAREAGGAEFRQMDYAEIAAGALRSRFDVVVCNFALFGRKSVEELVHAVPALLNPGGAFLVQTLHPAGSDPGREGWREGSWAGFGPAFRDPAPWFCRSANGWLRLFEAAGLPQVRMCTPADPDTGSPLSLLFTAGRAR